MLADVADFDPGGVISKGVGFLLKGGSLGGVTVRGGDVGPEPQDGAGPEYVSPQGRATAHQEANDEAGGVEVGTILRWKRKCRKRALRILVPISRGSRIQFHSIL